MAKFAKGDDDNIKEPPVIYGKLEVAKLFSTSHASVKLFKNMPNARKQAISLARWEQDPMTEVLNLWHPIISENAALSLNLHQMQRAVPPAKLYEGLESIAVKCVNAVGIDLNLIVDHQHMHSLVQFVSGLGPRKAKMLIQKIRHNARKLRIRAELFSNHLLGQNVYMSASGFIRILQEDSGDKKSDLTGDLLDQTRIHTESYNLAKKIAIDAIEEE